MVRSLFPWPWPAGCHRVCRGRAAAWLNVDWTRQPVDETAVTALAAQAKRRQLRYFFPLVTYSKEDGTTNPTFDHAAAFVSTVRQHNREAMLLAWIGAPAKNEHQFGIHSWVDLSDPLQRRQIADAD